MPTGLQDEHHFQGELTTERKMLSTYEYRIIAILFICDIITRAELDALWEGQTWRTVHVLSESLVRLQFSRHVELDTGFSVKLWQ